MKESKEKKTSLLPILWRLMGYLVDHKVKLTVATLAMVGVALTQAFVPGLMGQATNLINEGSGAIGQLRNVILIFIVIILFFWLFGFISQRFLAYIAQEGLYKLRTELFDYIQTFSLNFFDRRPIGELMSRVTNDTDVIEQFFNAGFMQFVQSLMTIVVVTIIMLCLNLWLTLIAYLVILGQVAFSAIMAKISGPAFEELQETMADINGFAEERLAGQKTTIAYCQQESSKQEMEEMSLQAYEVGSKAQFSALINQPAANLGYSIQITLLFIFGGWMVIEGQFALGQVITFFALAAILSGPLSQIFASYSQIISAIIGASRVFEILDEKPQVVDKADAIPMPPIEGVVDFKNVYFSYVPGRRVLEDNNFHIEPGQMIGLCGPTGAGKSTIINILTRYYDIDSGAIEVDEHRVDEVKQDALRIQIAQVLQEPFLFSNTIMENLKYGREGATDEECIEAAKQANAHDYIMSQPEGYQSMLVDGGADLSQGQRQMLTIARAIVANPRMLILDEATSSIDTRTEKLIQKGIMQLQKGKTSFFIAHRLSTIRNSDMILVIESGKIVERGRHEELMQEKGLYHQMFMDQFRGKLAQVTGVE